jgi:hypothetical protein
MTVLGRQIADTVATFAPSIDITVTKLMTAYDQGGRPYFFTSHNGSAGIGRMAQPICGWGRYRSMS